MYGLEEGVYYSIYNNIESTAIKNEERAKFTGNCTAVDSILSIIFPLIFGGLIYKGGFIKSLGVIIVIVILQMFFSLMIKDDNIPKDAKADLKGYKEIVKNSKEIQAEYNAQFFTGLTYSEGAFSYIVTIYIIKVFSDSISLGIFTSIFSIISVLIGMLFAKKFKPKHYNKIIKISMTFTIISLCMMIYKCNMITIILFNLFQTFSKKLVDLINGNNEANISNMDIIKKKYKVEFWLGSEAALFKGRIISNTLFIIMAYVGADIMIYIFVIFLALYGISSIKLQKELDKNNIKYI